MDAAEGNPGRDLVGGNRCHCGRKRFLFGASWRLLRGKDLLIPLLPGFHARRDLQNVIPSQLKETHR